MIYRDGCDPFMGHCDAEMDKNESDQQTIDGIEWRSLDLIRKKYIEYRDLVLLQEPEPAEDHPQKIYFEISSLCNLNCTMCFRHTWIDEGTGLLDKEVVLRTLEDDELLESVHTVFFGGMGEPFTHPDLVEMVGAVHNKGKRVEVITNGTLLTRSMSRSLLEAGLDELWISVDGFSIDAYENIRMGSSFEAVTDHMTAFNEERKACGREDAAIGVTFVASESNASQLLQLPAFVERFKIKDVNISNMIPNTAELEDEVLYDRVLGEYMDENASELTDFHTYNIPVMDLRNETVREAYEKLKPYLGKARIPDDWQLMKTPWCRFVNEDNVYVSWDGDVVPCMGLLHSSYTYLFGTKRKVMRHSFGNVYEKSLREVWEDQEFAKFRDKVKRFDFSPCMLCGGCERREDNASDCFGNEEPTCGACIWAYNYASCP